MPRPARGPPLPTRMSACARVGTRLPPTLSRGGRKTGTSGRACCASGLLRRGRDRGGTFIAGLRRLAQQVLRACGARQTSFASAGQQILRACGARPTSFASVGQQVLRACGAQDDKLARFGDGKKRNYPPSLILLKTPP